MYRWYGRAARCYVYLSDVSTTKRRRGDENAQNMWESAFRASEWFSRGWTLQELLAPGLVEFFSRERKRLGDKRSLSRQIYEITGIALPALQGTSLSQFSVDERFKWTQNRHTTREEDLAYCLLGIFDISMPVIYGEGRERAVNRLRKEINEASNGNSKDIILEDLLKRLPVASDAHFNSQERQHEPICLPETRIDLLQDIYDWADGQDERYIFWLSGLAGMGKSTIARTIARKFFDQKRLAASFFFARGGGDVGNASKIVTSIAMQLTSSVRALRRHISDALSENSDITSLSLHDQWLTLVLRPLSKLEGNGHRAYVIVVDALDECEDSRNIGMILQLLAEARALKTARLRLFLTSRPEIPIRYGFSQIPDAEHKDFILHIISRSIVDHDISVLLKHNLKVVAQERSLNASWPGEEAISRMVEIASGVFIWAATACRFVREGKHHATRRLDTIVKSTSSATTTTAPEKSLDEIYTTVLKHSIPSEYTGEEMKESYRMLRQVLGSIVILYTTLSSYSLSRLLHIPEDNLDQTVVDLHSILNIPKDNTQPIRLHHPSFRDFLLNNTRCQEPNLWVEERQAHQMLAENCIRLMSTSLKQDICHLGTPGRLVTDVESSRVERYLHPELQYACLYWIWHLQRSCAQHRDEDHVHRFLQEHLLHWLEAFGWMRKVSEGIHAISTLELFASSSESPCLSTFIHDAKRFVLFNRSAIERAPMQTYCSALVFAPTTSVIRRHFEANIPRWVRRLPKVDSNWSALLQTLGGHSFGVNAVIFSSDGNMLASASRNGDDYGIIRLWDASSGGLIRTLESHGFNAVVFSPDCKLLASANSDGTVKLWYTTSGGLIRTLESHGVNAVVFSPDCKLLASANSDGTVRLWYTSSGDLIQTIKDHSDPVITVAFSSDGKQLVSLSNDGALKLRNASSGVFIEAFESCLGPIDEVAFSSDGKSLISASKNAIKLWDIQPGYLFQTLELDFDMPIAFALSPNGKLLAVGDHRTVKPLNARSGELIQTLEGHLDYIHAVAFSPDGKLLASASEDTTVKLWDTCLRSSTLAPNDHSNSVNSVVFSPDGKLLASASQDQTVKLWDTKSRQLIQTFEGNLDWVIAVAFSPNGKQLASTCGGSTKLWDVSLGLLVRELKVRSKEAHAIAFSPDGELLALLSTDRTIRLWDLYSGLSIQTLESREISPNAMAFSPDSKMLASNSPFNNIELLDIQSGELVQTFESHSNRAGAVAFSPNSKMLALALFSDMTIQLFNIQSGESVQTLESHSKYVDAVAFSPNSKMLALSSFLDKTVQLLDIQSGASLRSFQVDCGIQTISFSEDGNLLHTNRGSLSTAFLFGESTPQANHFPCVFIKEEWVSDGINDMLWIPFEYRPSDHVADVFSFLGHNTTVHGSTVGFGLPSGQVVFMEFDFKI